MTAADDSSALLAVDLLINVGDQIFISIHAIHLENSGNSHINIRSTDSPIVIGCTPKILPKLVSETDQIWPGKR